MSFLEAGAHPGGGVRQRLTPEYLAKQLPLFQERVPRVTQVCVCERERESVCVCVFVCVLERMRLK